MGRKPRAISGKGVAPSRPTMGNTQTPRQSPYHAHPDTPHIATLPLPFAGGAKACRLCGRWMSEIAREQAAQRKKDKKEQEREASEGVEEEFEEKV